MVRKADPCASTRTIYLIEPEDVERQRLVALLRRHYDNVEVFDSTDLFITEKETVTSGCVIVASVSESSAMTALEFVKWLKRKEFDLAVLVIGDESNVHQAVSLLRAGASDFVARPFTDYKLRLAVNRVLK